MMLLQPIPFLSTEQRESLKPKKNDIVLYQGVKYVVDQVGLKYVNMHRLDEPRALGMAKIQEVSKYFEPEEEDPAEAKWKAGITDF